MTFSPFIVTVLALCWIAPALIIAAKYCYDRYADRGADAPCSENRMDVESREVVLDVTLHDGGLASDFSYDRQLNSVLSEARISTATTVAAHAPFGTATVSVSDQNGDATARHCSVCLN